MATVVILVLSLITLLLLRAVPGPIGRLAGPHQLALALALPIAANFGGTYTLFAIGTMGLMLLAPAITGRGLELPHAADVALRARLYVFALPMMPILTRTVAVSGLTLVQMTYVNLLSLGMVMAMIRAGQSLRTSSLAGWDVLAAIMILVQLFMNARGQDAGFAVRATLNVLMNLGLPYLIVSRACLRARAPDMLLLSLVVAGCVLAVMAPAESVHHWLFYDSMPAAANADPELISGYTKQRDGLLRAHVTYGESTGLSLLFGLLIVMVFALRDRIGPRRIAAGLALLLSAGLLFTFARVGYIVVALGLPACAAYERRWRQLATLLLVLPGLMGVLLVAARYLPVVAASIGISDDAAGSVDYRSQLLTAGLQLIRENWLTGISLKTLLEELAFLQTGEQIVDLVNQPLVIFIQAGVFGGLLYFAMFGAVLATLFARGPRLDADARAAGAACFAGLIGMMGSLTTTSFGRNEITYIVLLAAGAGVAARRRRPRPVASPAAEQQEIQFVPADAHQ
ncbi:O-antigen ligase family protein [Sphingomonas prati]|uniref:O-antigen ligase-related domain-containing protein n=1 Tax=Sphingomonas prati TaxID=1843237 RepID=A0A7W9BTF0_9SPHN|nr:O-antigen ligase family protein [Sphingomonas prati]MBB5729701.1 hypothetical protein [Sphingomonas prati]GGE90140.1 hypothetical protein GCM10011404_23820 [Sphingomonas prati]